MSIKLLSPKKAPDRRQQQRDLLFPGAAERVWNRTVGKGFTSVPRTLPLLLRIVDELSSGAPLSATYLELWCRIFDEGFIELNQNQEMAHAAGFGGQRPVPTWTARLDRLAELGFIEIAPGPYGPRSYLLMVNPYLAVNRLKQKLPSALLNAFYSRAIAVRANEAALPQPPPVALAPPATPVATGV